MAFEHPNAISQWTTMEFRKEGEMETVLVIETDLALSPENPRYDGERLKYLEQAIADYVIGPPSDAI